MLKGSLSFEHFQEYSKIHKKDYNIIVQNCPEIGDKISFEMFSRTFVIVLSRIYEFNSTKALVPFADMFNHNYNKK